MTTASSPDISSPVPLRPIPAVPVIVDSKGRMRISKEQRQTILAELERSGVTVARFAQRTGLKYSTLAGWVQRYRRAKRRRRVPPVRLLEAVMASATPAAGLTVQLPGGARLELHEASQIPLATALVQALARPC